MLKPPRRLAPDEIETLLSLDAVAHLASIDRSGFPHVTPLWFVWLDGAFVMTSIADRPHLRRLARDPRAGIIVDVEEAERDDGQRPNRQVRAVGRAELFRDEAGAWTDRITAKYLRGAGAEAMSAARRIDERVGVRLHPARLIGLASI